MQFDIVLNYTIYNYMEPSTHILIASLVINSAVFPLMHINQIFAVVIKTKEFKNMFTQFKKYTCI